MRVIKFIKKLWFKMKYPKTYKALNKLKKDYIKVMVELALELEKPLRELAKTVKGFKQGGVK